MNGEDYTYTFKAQIKTLGGMGERFEDIEYVITTETELKEAQARSVFMALYPNDKIHRVIEFRRLPV
jgi:hypothetical protein